jgi:hypothetical protein
LSAAASSNSQSKLSSPIARKTEWNTAMLASVWKSSFPVRRLHGSGRAFFCFSIVLASCFSLPALASCGIDGTWEFTASDSAHGTLEIGKPMTEYPNLCEATLIYFRSAKENVFAQERCTIYVNSTDSNGILSCTKILSATDGRSPGSGHTDSFDLNKLGAKLSGEKSGSETKVTFVQANINSQAGSAVDAAKKTPNASSYSDSTLAQAETINLLCKGQGKTSIDAHLADSSPFDETFVVDTSNQTILAEDNKSYNAEINDRAMSFTVSTDKVYHSIKINRLDGHFDWALGYSLLGRDVYRTATGSCEVITRNKF